MKRANLLLVVAIGFFVVYVPAFVLPWHSTSEAWPAPSRRGEGTTEHHWHERRTTVASPASVRERCCDGEPAGVQGVEVDSSDTTESYYSGREDGEHRDGSEYDKEQGEAPLRWEIPDCTFGVEPLPGRSLEEQRRSIASFAENGGVLMHQHIRKSGGSSLRAKLVEYGLCGDRTTYSAYQRKVICHEAENGAVRPEECAEQTDNTQGTIFIGALRDPVARILSEYDFAGPGSNRTGKVKQWVKAIGKGRRDGASALFEWRNSCKREHGPVNYMLRGFYTPNAATCLLSGGVGRVRRGVASIQSHTLDEIPPVPYQYDPWHRAHVCTEYPFPFLDDERRNDTVVMLEAARRAVVSYDAVIPLEHLDDDPLVHLLGRRIAPEAKSGKKNSAKQYKKASVHTNVSEEVIEAFARENWADVELIEFARQVYDCKKEFFERLLDLYAGS